MATTLHQLVASHAAATSSAVFVYDSTVSAPFGQDLKSDDAKVFNMQTRPGAGAALVGFVERLAFSSEGASDLKASAASQTSAAGLPVSVLANSASLLALVPSILSLPKAGVRPTVSIHVSAQTSKEESLVQTADLASLFAATSALSASFEGAIVLSENARSAVAVSTGLAGSLANAGHDLISVFDGLTSGRTVEPLAAWDAAKTTSGSLVEIVSSFTPFFTYAGSSTATTVVVLAASAESAEAKAQASGDVGVLAVHVLAPWSPARLLEALPKSAKKLLVASDLVDLVLEASLSSPSAGLKVRALTESWKTVVPAISATLLPATTKLASFWGVDASAPAVPSALVKAFADPSTGVYPSLLTTYDNFSNVGLSLSQLLLSPEPVSVPVSSIAESSAPSVLFLSNPSAVLRSYAPFDKINAKTSVVVWTPWLGSDLAKKLPLKAFEAIKSHPLLYLVDVDGLAKANHVPAAAVAELVFWLLYLPGDLALKDSLALIGGSETFKSWSAQVVAKVHAAVRGALVPAKVEGEPEVDPSAEVKADLPTLLIPTAAGPNDFDSSAPAAAPSSWKNVAQRVIYPAAFDSKKEQRPDLHEQNFIITVSENRRLTPTTYDRNVFHLEFDLAGTGLKYSVGEALGIHGHNDAEEVQQFLDWYGLKGEDIVELPSHHFGDDIVEQRTIFQIFQQHLDLFGRPGKSFYSELAKFATNKEEERALRFIGAPEGVATFKKWAEVDFVTYADVIQKFPSARPGVEDLVRIVEEIKPRHYSISSAQNFVGDSVHLLVVTVEWETEGKPRFGQCTRYLAGLKKGDKVMVSVKPSVMKLPPSDLAPIIMAGLGTGAAPFRAFIQERAYMAAQGKEVGPALYYFGSRHRSKEYLYGEEIEAYVREGIVTHTGLAFSRDTSAKVYIQNKMNEDSELLNESLKEGSFYLCGPTYPVPDVYAALIKSLVGGGLTEEQAEARIEELKEEERYVLEVY